MKRYPHCCDDSYTQQICSLITFGVSYISKRTWKPHILLGKRGRFVFALFLPRFVGFNYRRFRYQRCDYNKEKNAAKKLRNTSTKVKHQQHYFTYRFALWNPIAATASGKRSINEIKIMTPAEKLIIWPSFLNVGDPLHITNTPPKHHYSCDHTSTLPYPNTWRVHSK